MSSHLKNDYTSRYPRLAGNYLEYELIFPEFAQHPQSSIKVQTYIRMSGIQILQS